MENQNKIKKVLIGLWLGITTAISVIFIIACVVGGIQSKKESKPVSACVEQDIISYNINYDINFKPVSKNVSYDDVSNEIELTGDELQFSYLNLFDVLEPLDMGACSLAYNSYSYQFSPQDFLYFESANTSTYIILYPDGKFMINTDGQQEFLLDLSKNLIISSDDYYSGIKSAIELDIQANTVSPSFNESIFQTLTSSTVGFIGTISSGITSMVAVFYTNDSLTLIGNLAVIVVAVSLAYFLFRLIFGLIRMRG